MLSGFCAKYTVPPAASTEQFTAYPAKFFASTLLTLPISLALKPESMSVNFMLYGQALIPVSSALFTLTSCPNKNAAES